MVTHGFKDHTERVAGGGGVQKPQLAGGLLELSRPEVSQRLLVLFLVCDLR
jgi:hypothetical protein